MDSPDNQYTKGEIIAGFKGTISDDTVRYLISHKELPYIVGFDEKNYYLGGEYILIVPVGKEEKAIEKLKKNKFINYVERRNYCLEKRLEKMDDFKKGFLDFIDEVKDNSLTKSQFNKQLDYFRNILKEYKER
jgi:hypothetical protein